jgi:hypothetical protein
MLRRAALLLSSSACAAPFVARPLQQQARSTPLHLLRIHRQMRHESFSCRLRSPLPPQHLLRSFASNAPRDEQHLATTLGQKFVAAAPAALQPYLKLSR